MGKPPNGLIVRQKKRRTWILLIGEHPVEESRKESRSRVEREQYTHRYRTRNRKAFQVFQVVATRAGRDLVKAGQVFGKGNGEFHGGVIIHKEDMKIKN